MPLFEFKCQYIYSTGFEDIKFETVFLKATLLTGRNYIFLNPKKYDRLNFCIRKLLSSRKKKMKTTKFREPDKELYHQILVLHN